MELGRGVMRFVRGVAIVAVLGLDQLAQWGLRLHPEIKRSNTYDVVHVSLRDLRVRDPRGPSLFTEAVDTILSFIKG